MNNKPNLLIIQTDQQSLWTISALGSTLIHTPHIDYIAREGAVFENFYTVCALCTPSRGSFLTGRYPCMNGAYDNDMPINKEEVTLAHNLRENGYHTGYAGKWHLAGAERPGWMKVEDAMGFTECQYMFNRGHWKSIIESDSEELMVSNHIGDERSYTTDWLADKTIEFIRNRRKNKPFFHMLSIPDPHTPFSVREPYASMFDKEKMPIPETYENKSPNWPFLKKEYAHKIFNNVDINTLKNYKAQYLGEVKCIDDNVGKILQCLSDEGILEETIIVFTSDHGEYFGEHNLWGKNQVYESVYHIPFFICWPGHISKGTVVHEFVSNVDFQKTILSLMNVEPCGREVGYDASSLIKEHHLKNNPHWKNEIFIHHSEFQYAGIVTPEYHLTLVKDSEHVLFNREKDPAQTNNLFYWEQYQTIIDRLINRIIEHHTTINSPAASWLVDLY